MWRIIIILCLYHPLNTLDIKKDYKITNPPHIIYDFFRTMVG